MDAAFIKKVLKFHYSRSSGEWVMLFELCTRTGGAVVSRYHALGENYIDAFAFNCWPSKNYCKEAFEIKVSRQDFKNELKQPSKNLLATIFSNKFYFVTPQGMLNKGEIPRGSGLIEVKDTGEMFYAVKAPETEAVPMPNSMLMSALRNALKSDVDATFKQGYDSGVVAGRQEVLYKSEDKQLRDTAAALSTVQNKVRLLEQKIKEKDDTIFKMLKESRPDVLDLGAPC